MRTRQKTYRLFSILFLLLISIYSTAGIYTISASKIKKVEKTSSSENDSDNSNEVNLTSLNQPAVINAAIDLEKDAVLLQENTLQIVQEEHFEPRNFCYYISYLDKIFSSNIQVNAP